MDGLERGTAHVYARALSMLFLPKGRPATWRMFGMLPRAAAPDEAPDSTPSLDDLQALSDAFTGGELQLRDPAWLNEFRLHHRLAAYYRAGRVFLAGDAAHVHSPAGAQGVNIGIQDAWNLGWKLALVVRGRAPARLLDTYEAERRPFGKFLLRFTDRAFTISTSRGRLVRLARTQVASRLMPLALRFGPGRAYGFRVVSQLAIRYRSSPAVQEGEPKLRRGPRAGDRLPDALVRDGQPSSLHGMLAAPRFHLLLCGPLRWGRVGLAALREVPARVAASRHVTGRGGW